MKDSPLTLTIPHDPSRIPSEEGTPGHIYESNEGYVYLCIRVGGVNRPMYVCLSDASLYKPVLLEKFRLRPLGKLSILSEEE